MSRHTHTSPHVTLGRAPRVRVRRAAAAPSPSPRPRLEHRGLAGAAGQKVRTGTSAGRCLEPHRTAALGTMRAWLLGPRLACSSSGRSRPWEQGRSAGKPDRARPMCDKKLRRQAGVCQHTDKAGKKMRKKCKITCSLCDEGLADALAAAVAAAPAIALQQGGARPAPVQELAEAEEALEDPEDVLRSRSTRRSARGSATRSARSAMASSSTRRGPRSPTPSRRTAPPAVPALQGQSSTATGPSTATATTSTGRGSAEGGRPGQIRVLPANAHQWSLHGSSPAGDACSARTR